jgi:hypothetical protein
VLKNKSLLAGCAVVILLTTAACGSKSTPAAASTSSPAASGAATSAPASAPMSSAAADSAAASSGPAESAPDSSGAASSAGPESSVVAASSAPVSGSDGALDATSAAWFSTLCTGQTAAAQITPKIQAAVAAATTDAEKAKAASPFLTEGGKDFTDLATALAALPAPGIPNGSEFATKQIAALKEKGNVMIAAGTGTSSGDPSKLLTFSQELTTGPATTAANALSLPAATKAAVKALPACAALSG